MGIPARAVSRGGSIGRGSPEKEMELMQLFEVDRFYPAAPLSGGRGWIIFNQKETVVPREHIAAGTKVAAGTYRCNGCANEHECKEEGEALPMCEACGSISWRTRRVAKSGGKPEKNDP